LYFSSTFDCVIFHLFVATGTHITLSLTMYLVKAEILYQTLCTLMNRRSERIQGCYRAFISRQLKFLHLCSAKYGLHY